MGSGPAKVLPLRVWLYSIVLAAAVMSVAALYYLSARQEAGATAASLAQRFLADQPDGHKVRVLALGSSLLWAATPPGHYADLQGVDWIRMTKSGGGVGHLRAVLDVLDRHPPGILVIETNLLLPPSPELIIDEMRTAFAPMLKEQLAPLMTGGGPGNAANTHMSDQDTRFPCDVLAPAAIRRQLAGLVVQQSTSPGRPEIDTLLLTRLLRLSRQGVHIVLLEVRRSSQFEQALADERQSWLQRWKAAMPPGPHLSYLVFPDFQDPNLYCDGRHLNAAGARRFEAWWKAQLQHMVKGG